MKKWVIAVAVWCLACLIRPVADGYSKDDWQWWVYTPVSYKITPEVKADVTGLFRWKNDMEDFYYRGCLVGGYYSLTPWLSLGGHYWFKETRSSTQTPWVETNTFLVRADFKYRPVEWCVLQEANRLEYDTRIDRWKLRVKPKAVFPLDWLGLKGIGLFIDNEFFFAFDYQDDRDFYSENRATIGINAKVIGPLALAAAYRNVGKKSAATGNWDFTNVLATYAKLAF